MESSHCIFCSIINKTIPSTIIKENEHILVIQDIHPKAPIHYLIIPKKHIASVDLLANTDNIIGWAMLQMARDLGKEVPSHAFNLISNNGAAAGQSVHHLHMHFLAGKNLYEHGLAL
jgi:histidine triad (HIT) family protein